MTIQNLNTTSDRLFFGTNGHSIARYDIVRYPYLQRLNKNMRSKFWEPEAINVSAERRSFQSMTAAEQFVFTANIQRPTIMDSIQGRAPTLVFGAHCTDSTLENCITTWQFFESIHSESYTHIERAVWPDPTQIVTAIPENAKLQLCTSTIAKAYDDMIKNPTKENLYLALINANALEAIRFQMTFAFMFNFKERALMNASGDIFKYIARDEAFHLAMTQFILRTLPKDDPEFVEIVADNRNKALAIFQTAVDEEKEWAEYSFSAGPVLGMTLDTSCAYLDHLYSKQLNAVGLSTSKVTQTPLRFIGKYLAESDSVQTAPQEDGTTTYLSATTLTNDLEDFIPDF